MPSPSAWARKMSNLGGFWTACDGRETGSVRPSVRPTLSRKKLLVLPAPRESKVLPLRKLVPAILALLAAGTAADAQQKVYSAWVQRNGDGPQPFFFGYGRPPEIAERVAFSSCGGDCTILKSGQGCVSITMGGQEFLPLGCRVDPAPELPVADPGVPADPGV